MKPFQIFRPGKHTSNAGVTLEFSEAQLRESIAAYDPALHQAPITVGHPKDNLPAYGWIGALSFVEDHVEAEPVQLEPAFEEMAKAGRFNKRSASWYLPDAAANPTPGKLYLRHVAFLGAQPPAIKGLKELQFTDDDDGVIEFSDSVSFSTIADLFRGLREWLIGKFGLETADQVLPSYRVASLEQSASQMNADAVTALPSFSEDEEMPITQEQLDAAVAAAKTEAENAAQAKIKTEIDAVRAEAKAAAEKRDAEFAEQDKAVKATLERLAANERAAKRASLGVEVDELIKAGKVLPASKETLVSFIESLGADDSLEFGEGDGKKKVSQRDYMLDFLKNSPTAVEYNELAGASDFGEADGSVSAAALAEKAQALAEKARAEGRPMSITQAVYEVSKIRRVA